MDRATVGGGCFWCIEAAFQQLPGVESVTSGYAGGDTDNPTYEEVCSGTTGHAEVVQIEYDPNRLSYEDLLSVFFRIHDPTTRDREGPDIGSQYRSAIFADDEDQLETAKSFVDALETEGVYEDPIVTEIEPLETFYEAEAYHQNYFERVQAGDPNTNRAYCEMYAAPKVEKVRKEFVETTAQTD